MSAIKAAEEVLKKAGKPLRFAEIANRALMSGLWSSNGKTPEATVHAQLAVNIQRKGVDSIFQRTDKGTFALREWGLPEYLGPKSKEVPPPVPVKETVVAKDKTMSFTGAAEHVLEKFGNKQPMHYREITKKALELRLVNTAGKTPEATMYAQVLTETKRKQKRGEQPRFVMHGKGFVGLTKWMGRGLAFQIEQHDKSVRKKLHEHIRKVDPAAFEELVGELLGSLGFEEVTVTAKAGDGGIDVRGTLVVGDVIKTRMAVQVKRWKNNVQSPTVQQVRGSLGAHEQGLIITTSDFSKGARSEAERPDAIPVGLMSGEQFVTLLMENDLGVTRRSHDLFEIDE